jgi:hypothetical protein
VLDLGQVHEVLFNLQHNTGKVMTEQHAHLNTYAEQATHTSHEMERLEHENALLCHGSCESSEKELELQFAYHRLSEAEHGLNYARQQINLARDKVDTHTHVIMHLETTVGTQDAELKERAEIIINLQQ